MIDLSAPLAIPIKRVSSVARAMVHIRTVLPAVVTAAAVVYQTNVDACAFFAVSIHGVSGIAGARIKARARENAVVLASSVVGVAGVYKCACLAVRIKRVPEIARAFCSDCASCCTYLLAPTVSVRAVGCAGLEILADPIACTARALSRATARVCARGLAAAVT